MKLSQGIILGWVIMNLLLAPFASGSKEDPSSVTLEQSFIPSGFGKVTQKAFPPSSLPPAPSSSFLLWYLPIPLLFFIGKKGQVTIFLILALVIIMVFGTLLYLMSTMAKIKLQKKVDAVFQEAVETSSISHYVTLCLEKSLKEGIRRLGAQGGFIYDPQYASGASSLPKGFNLSDGGIGCRPQVAGPNNFAASIAGYLPLATYGITYNTSCALQPSAVHFPPHYPCPLTIPLGPDDLCDYSYSRDWPYFGSPLRYNLSSPIDILPPLCKDVSCGPGAAQFSYSMQEQLEKYIAHKVYDCVNLSGLEPILGLNVSKSDNVTVSATISDASIAVDLNFPLDITTRNRRIATKVLEYHTSAHVRLRLVTNAMRNILSSDSRNATYNIITSNGLIMAASNLDMNRTDLLINEFVTEFSIIDPESMIDGNPFVFKVVIPNRIPPLERIDDGSGYIDPLTNVRYHLRVPEGTTLIVSPLAIDPDDDTITYVYKGWKVDYDERYYFGAGLAPYSQVYRWSDASKSWGPPVVASSRSCWYNSTGDAKCSPANFTQQLTNSSLYVAGTDAAGFNCMNPITNSVDLYRCAAARLNAWDIGPHNITIHALDDAGRSVQNTLTENCPSNNLADCQQVRIFVQDIPHAVANGSNIYDDINDTFASVEGPYTLDASESECTLCSGLEYRWQDRYDPFDISTGNTLYELPQTAGLDILTIKPLNFNTTTPTAGVDERVNLTVSVVGGGVPASYDLLNVTVLQCLPHRNDSAAFPFQNISGDSYPDLSSVISLGSTVRNYTEFMANHTCCSDAPGSYGQLTPGAQCYSFSEITCAVNQYGGGATPTYPDNPKHYFRSSSPNYFSNNSMSLVNPDLRLWPASESLDPGATIVNTPGWPSSINDPSANDVFNRSYGVACDNTRGNICNGTKTDTWDNFQTCLSYQFCQYNVSTCQNWGYTPSAGKYYFCDANTAPRCFNQVGATVPASAEGSGNLLARYVVSGDGVQCKGIASVYSPAYKDKVRPNGILEQGNFFVGVNCDYYDHKPLVTAPDASGTQAPISTNQVGYWNGSFQQTATGSWQSKVGATGTDYSCGGSSCIRSAVDPDTNSVWCSDVFGSTCGGMGCFQSTGETTPHGSYNPPGNSQDCCGDDVNEYFVDSRAFTNSYACCDTADSSQCVVNGKCLSKSSDQEINNYQQAYPINPPFRACFDTMDSDCDGNQGCSDLECNDALNPDNNKYACSNSQRLECNSSTRCNILTLKTSPTGASQSYYCDASTWTWEPGNGNGIACDACRLCNGGGSCDTVVANGANTGIPCDGENQCCGGVCNSNVENSGFSSSCRNSPSCQGTQYEYTPANSGDTCEPTTCNWIGDPTAPYQKTTYTCNAGLCANSSTPTNSCP